MDAGVVSIIIPVYNAEKYLDRCLRSAIDQSYTNLEIVCVDDGSTDRSREILAAYAKQNGQVEPIFLPANGGVSHARNVGLDHATGDYIMFLDADDWIHRDCVSACVRAGMQKGVAVGRIQNLLDPADVIDTDQSVRPGNTDNIYTAEKAAKLTSVKFGACAKLYARSVIGNVRFHEQLRYGEDTLFNLEILSLQKPDVALLDQTLYYYDRSHESATSTMKLSEEIKYVKVLVEKHSQNRAFTEQAIKEALSARYVAITKKKRSEESELNDYLKQLKKDLGTAGYISGKERLVLKLFIAFPSLYRLFRIHNDKSLLTWEKAIKGEKTHE